MPLVFVPTPLGNLRDITLRALDVLSECSLLVAEDSRVARKLLSALELPGKEIWTYHDHNARGATANILDRAREETVAVVTDAGTPGISDPGMELVAAARQAGVALEVLPGASALIGAAVLSGFALRRFIFEGFPPRTAGARRRAFAQSFALSVTSIWYESPQRILAALADVHAVDPRARVFLLREYTKQFEEQISGTAQEVAAQLEQPVRGEVAFAVLPAQRDAPAPEEKDIDEAIDAALVQGQSVADAAKMLSERGLGERRSLYARISGRKHLRKEGADPGR
ncbi:MAG: 16S rRNA (cytidine(1402)-2'-O)-methyltransferase [Candidatus Baltobacteraceae bacterium]